MPTFAIEQSILNTRPAAVIAGVDEAGRGPWAGPVVAGAAILDATRLPSALRDGLDDSKKLTEAKRETLFALLHASPGVVLGVGQASVAEIDEFNILRATFLAMRRAVNALGIKIDIALVDGNGKPDLDCDVTPVVKGDTTSLSIAAASVVAKVTRDRIMRDLAIQHPGYGWERNMGYGTPGHQAGLQQCGVSAHHRRSFAPIRVLLNSQNL